VARLPILHFLNLDSVGGVERYLAAFLAHRGSVPARQGVFLLSRSIHPFLDGDVRARAEAVHAWKRIGPWKLPKWPPAVRAAYRAHVARRYAGGVALFWNTLGEVDGLRAARRGGLVSVYWERGLAWHRMRQEEGAAEFLSGVDAVIANSHAGRRILQTTRGVSGPIEVCRNALRADARPRDPQVRSLSPHRPLRVGVAARFVSYKGVSLALHAMAELLRREVRAELSIAGSGPLEPELRALATELGLDGPVRFLGEVADVRSFYEDLDLLWHPALCEPCANVLPEAQAHGVPVIAALVDGNPELVVEGETGLLLPPTLSLADYGELGAADSPMPPYVYDPAADSPIEPRAVDPERLAEATLELVADPGRYHSLSAGAIDHVRDGFDAEAQLEEVMDLLARFSAGMAGPTGRFDALEGG